MNASNIKVGDCVLHFGCPMEVTAVRGDALNLTYQEVLAGELVTKHTSARVSDVELVGEQLGLGLES